MRPVGRGTKGAIEDRAGSRPRSDRSDDLGAHRVDLSRRRVVGQEIEDANTEGIHDPVEFRSVFGQDERNFSGSRALNGRNDLAEGLCDLLQSGSNDPGMASAGPA